MNKQVPKEEKNIIHRLLEYKHAMRNCIQKGAERKEIEKITEEHGFTLATPV